MEDFNYWKEIHNSGNIIALSKDRQGLLWLKIKSIIRKDILADFLSFANLQLHSTKLQLQFGELYQVLSRDVEEAHAVINEFIKQENKKIISSLDTDQIISELYKLKSFDWGGDYNNSLDKFLVSHYVKPMKSYDELLTKFDTEISRAVQGYVLNSWYNHWSSILIEYIFKSHPKVLPTVGQIKNVDFFIDDIPFDLKVTYFPNKFLKLKRKEKGLPVEITYLKQKAKEIGINYDKKGKENDVYYEITEKLKDKDCTVSRDTLNTIQEQRDSLLSESLHNPSELIKWLYENQGEMRFGSENRLFLIVVDKANFNSSWKQKRNFELLRPSIKKYLDNFAAENAEDLKVTFLYKDKIYQALSDVIFIIK